MPDKASQYILTLSCANRLDAQQFDSLETGRFFARIVFDRVTDPAKYDALRADFSGIAADFGFTWLMRSRAEKKRVMILASKSDHCLVDLVYRWRIGELDMAPVGIISNHTRETYAHIDLDGVPFHYLPVTRETKMEQETEVWKLIRDTQTDVVVLARYMQVLSDGLAAKLAGRCINIDEGPIIEQDVETISHRDTPDDLVRKGRDIERRVLARALRKHLEDRVLLDGKKTIVFAD